MRLQALLSVPFGISSFLSARLPSFAIRQASTMAIDEAKLNGEESIELSGASH